MFEPEELMARIVDLEEQLKVSEMAPPAAEQLIACLEGEIAKRDETIARLEPQLNRAIQANYDLREELAACRVAVENCDLFRARIAELEAQYQRDVCGLNNEGDPIGGDPAGGYANDNARLRAELAAIKARSVVMPEHETSTPSSKWASAGESDPHGKAYDCERAELAMGEYTDDELANAVFMHDHRSFDIAATMRGEPGSIVLLTAAKDRIRWLSRSLDKALARLNATPVQQVSMPASAFASRAITHYEAALLAAFPSGSSGEVFNQWNEARRVLAAAPAAPAADAWVSVSERLPDVAQEVILYADFDGVCAGVLDSYGEWFAPCSEYKFIRVTHWMPLPAGPVAHHAKGVV